MILWTIQPLSVWQELNKKGYFICNPKKAENLNESEYYSFKDAYDWLNTQMELRVGKRPNGVQYPVWAWYRRDWKHKKPDLREAAYGKRGEKAVCLEIEIPDNQVLLSDYDYWHFVLNNWFLDNSTSEEEYDKMHDWFDSLPIEKKEKIKLESWNRIFDITPIENDWFSVGRYVQATFWCLKLSQVRKVQFFVCR